MPSGGERDGCAEHHPRARAGFGALLRRTRERALLSQEDLAARAGMSARTIRYLESGRTRRPRFASVRGLADALGLAGADRDRFERAALPPLSGEPAHDGPAATEPATPAPEPLLVTAGVGTAGVGRTELVVHRAHSAVAHVRDGQLVVDLHGCAATGPRPPADAPLLRDPGVAPTALPTDLGERAAHRTILAGRRLVIVLDDAASAEQVHPLLPGPAGCVVLVTGAHRTPPRGST